jgi:hypothetical protein
LNGHFTLFNEAGEEIFSSLGALFCAEIRSQPIECTSNLIQISQLSRIHWGDHFAFPTIIGDQAFSLKEQQSVTNRLTTDPELLSKLLLSQGFLGTQ